MLDLNQYTCLGTALHDALDRFANETCLIESDRDRERTRLTYSDFKQTATPLARALQDAEFNPGDRAAIIMTNQSKWLISAYAVFQIGGVLVPLDYKLTPDEQLQLLAHSKAKVPRAKEDAACVVYSSGTGGRPKGCVLTHENYLDQCKALTAWYPFWPGVRYLSVLPTNHAIDFMVGFIGPFVCGACVVHLRTLRPEFVRDAFVRYKITYVTLVPMIIKNLERGVRGNFDALPGWKRFLLDKAIALNKLLTRKQPNVKLSRMLLPGVHRAFGGELLALITGGAFIEPSTLQFFYDVGLPVANGYGLTEACTVLTVNDLKPFRADTVGKPLPGVELRILNPDSEGVGEVAAKSRTIMSHYVDDPELTAETIVDGWLLTGDLGRIDDAGHLLLFGRKKNMIVTEGGKNVYPEDIESAFEGVAIKEHCIFAANYIWPKKELVGETLVLVLHPDLNQEVTESIKEEVALRNRRLSEFKRVGGYVLWSKDFPRTASMKIKRSDLAQEIRTSVDRSAVKEL